jgi:hypothetical protein
MENKDPKAKKIEKEVAENEASESTVTIAQMRENIAKENEKENAQANQQGNQGMSVSPEPKATVEPLLKTESKEVEQIPPVEHKPVHINENQPEPMQQPKYRKVAPIQLDEEEDDEEDEDPRVIIIDRGKEPEKASVGCRSVAFLGCIIPLSLVLLMMLIVVLKPEPVWTNIKIFLNAGITTEDYVKTTEQFKSPDQVKERVTKDYEKKDNAEVNISEDEAAALVAKFLPNSSKTFISVKPDGVYALTNVDTEEKPLWIELKFVVDGQNLVLDYMGLGRMSLPKQFLGSGQDYLNGRLSTVKINRTETFFATLLAYPDFDYKSLRLEENKIIIVK